MKSETMHRLKPHGPWEWMLVVLVLAVTALTLMSSIGSGTAGAQDAVDTAIVAGGQIAIDLALALIGGPAGLAIAGLIAWGVKNRRPARELALELYESDEPNAVIKDRLLAAGRKAAVREIERLERG